MMIGWDGGEGMVPERRQEHVPYLYSLSYLVTQCINTGLQNAGSHWAHFVV